MMPHRSRTEALRGHAVMLLFSVLVAGSFSLGATIAPMIDPAALTALRFLVAGAIIGTLIALKGGVRRAHLHAPWRYLVMGGLFAIYFVTMFEGLKSAPPISAAAVFTLTPILSAGFGWLLLRQITTPRMALALILAAIGALWVIFRGNFAAFLAFDIGRGEVIFFFGVVAHALYTPMIRKLNRGEPALVFTFGMMVAGFLLLVIYGAPAIVATDWTALPLIVWGTLGYLAVFASATTFFLVQYAVMRLPSAKVMAYTYLVPAWVILWEFARGNGFVQPVVLVGVALVVLALVLLLKD